MENFKIMYDSRKYNEKSREITLEELNRIVLEEVDEYSLLDLEYIDMEKRIMYYTLHQDVI